jgi:charged multivesicular body protein 3
MEFLFGTKKVDPIDQAKEWKRNVGKEVRKIEREIAHLGREEQKAIKECKKLAKSGQVSSAKVIAKEIVNTRHAVNRMHTAKSQLNSVANMLQNSISMMKVQGCVSKSTEVMAAVNNLVKLPELRATMQEMAREMTRAGLIDELVEDAMSSMDSEGIESEVDAEVDKIVQELTSDVLAPAAAAPKGPIKTAAAQQPAAAAAAVPSPEEVAHDEEIRAMQQRLQSL